MRFQAVCLMLLKLTRLLHMALLAYMEPINANVFVWRARFQRCAKELYPEPTVLHHAVVVAFKA